MSWKHTAAWLVLAWAVSAAPAIAATTTTEPTCSIDQSFTDPNGTYLACSFALREFKGSAKVQAELLATRSEAAYFANRFDLAAADAKDALELDAGNASARLRRAWLAIRFGDYAAAVDDATQILADDDRNTGALFVLGFAYVDTTEWKSKTLPAYLRALEIDPKAHLIRKNLAGLYADRMKRPDLAVAECDKILSYPAEELRKVSFSKTDARDPDFIGLVRTYRLQLLVHKLNNAVNLGEAEKLAADYPNSSTAQALLAEVYGHHMRWMDMLASAERSLALDPMGGSQRSSALEGYLALKRYEDGLRAAEMMLDMPVSRFDVARTFYFRAFYNKHLGRSEQALKDFEAAFSIDTIRLQSAITQLIQSQYYEGKISDAYTDKVKNALLACIADPACGTL